MNENQETLQSNSLYITDTDIKASHSMNQKMAHYSATILIGWGWRSETVSLFHHLKKTIL